jgi:hypothetical protein
VAPLLLSQTSVGVLVEKSGLLGLCRRAVVVVLGALSLAACAGGADSNGGAPDGSLGADGGEEPGYSQDDCADESKWIYLTGYGEPEEPGGLPPVKLLRFEPQDLTISEVGTIDCPGASAPGTSVGPTALAPDRDGYAWAFFGTHDYRQLIYRVRLSDAVCDPAPYEPELDGFRIASATWARRSEDAAEEVLHVSGWVATGLPGDASSTLGEPSVGILDLQSLTIADVRPIDFSGVGARPDVAVTWPFQMALQMELTTNALGELWGFVGNQLPLAVYQLDAASLTTTKAFDVAAIRPNAFEHGAQSGPVAFWGGRYFMFHGRNALIAGLEDSESKYNIYSLDPGTGDVAHVLDTSAYSIGTANVSSCAPATIL